VVPGRTSETGEDTAELQVHGGRAVIAALLAALGQLDGLRRPRPGNSPPAHSRTAAWI